MQSAYAIGYASSLSLLSLVLTAIVSVATDVVTSLPTATHLAASLQSGLSHATISAAPLAQSLADFVRDVVTWYANQDMKVLLTSLGAVTAGAAISSNWSALTEVRQSIISCKRPISFKSTDLGPSDPFIEPIRSLFFSFGLYVAFQIQSQIENLLVETTLQAFITEFALQSALFGLVAYQIFRIRTQAAKQFGENGKKLSRFQALFDKALENHSIRMTDLVRATFILPLSSLTPQFIQLFL